MNSATGAFDALAPEEQARANLYGLISRFFAAPPDTGFLAGVLAGNPGDDGGGAADSSLALAWRALQDGCRSALRDGDGSAVRDEVRAEYDGLFVGVGRAEVTPYVSAYAATAPDRYLVSLRERLASQGMSRVARAAEVEDHMSGVSDAMRRLIEEGRSLADQRRFFDEFAWPGCVKFLDAVQQSPNARFYRSVAAFAASFLMLERAAFDLEDPA